MTDRPRPTTKRRKRRYLLLGAALAMIALAVTAKHLLLPAYVRYRIQRALPTYWDGEGQVGQVEVNFLRSSHLRDVRLLDPSGRTWLRFDDAELTLRDMLTLDPVVVAVRFDRPIVRLHVDQGSIRPPLRDVPALIRWFRNATEIRRLAVDQGAVALAVEAGDVGIDRIVLLSERRAGRYHVTLLRPGGDAETSLLAEGSFQVGDAVGRLDVTVHLPASAAAFDWLSELTGMDALTLTDGRLDANVTLRGRWTHPLTWRPEGIVRARDLAFQAGGVPFAQGLDADALLGADGAHHVRADLSARRFCDGSGRATVELAMVDLGDELLAPTALKVSAEGTAVDLATLLASAGRLWKLPALASLDPDMPLGRLDGNLRYDGRWREDGTLGGGGTARFDGLRLLSLPVLGEHVTGLLAAVVPEGLSRASGSATIAHDGPQLLIGQGRLRSPLLTVKLDPNARIDLSAGTISLQATAWPALGDPDGPLGRLLTSQAGARRLLIDGSLADANDLRARLTPLPLEAPDTDSTEDGPDAGPRPEEEPEQRRQGDLLDRLGRWWDRLGLPRPSQARQVTPDANEGQ